MSGASHPWRHWGVRPVLFSIGEVDVPAYGVFMALNRDFEVEGYNSGAPRGDLVVHGGMIVDRNVLTGRYRADGSTRNGYTTYFYWDSRLVRTPPPCFPMTGNFVIDTWEEIDPPEA